MNQASSAVTAGVTFTAASIVPIISWAINGFPKPIPDTVPYLIAAILVAGSHLVINLVNNWMASKNKKDESSVAPDQPEVQSTDKAAS